jgi:hypothetical protein
MKLIDIDRLKMIESHIHYRKLYEASAVLMDKSARIKRTDIKFSVEYKPVGDPDIKVEFVNQPDFPAESVIPKIIDKISVMDSSGILAGLSRQ